jgi:Family of unknown function (DUF6677)
MFLGSWKNVYIPDVTKNNPGEVRGPAIVTNIWNRLQFAGQFWIGVAAWPAIMQYNNWPVPFGTDFQKAPDEWELNNLQRDGDKTWDLAWVYTVIAGVLNILVIYDAISGPAFVARGAAGPPARTERIIVKETAA